LATVRKRFHIEVSELDGLVVVGYRAIALAFPEVGDATIGEGLDKFRIELDCLVKVRDGALIVRLVAIELAAAVVWQIIDITAGPVFYGKPSSLSAVPICFLIGSSIFNVSALR
jgi:hypothetical protein